MGENIGYETGKWYMVEIDYKVFIPAKFIGIKNSCFRMGRTFHNFPHPGEAVFENIQLYNTCGFVGNCWEESDYNKSDGEYTSFRSQFREVSENDFWAVQAIEEFQKIIASRKKSFTIFLPNGFRLEAKVKPPKEKDNLPGEYYAKVINPKTGQNKEGKFKYDGKKESVSCFVLSNFPGWHILEIKQLKIFLG